MQNSGIREVFRIYSQKIIILSPFELLQTEDRFHLHIEASPCQFLVYDRNADGEISREEVRDVFPDEILAEKLFRDLDSIAGKLEVTALSLSLSLSNILCSSVL